MHAILDALGRRPRQGQTLIFDDPLNENEGFMSAPWAVFWSVFGAKMGSRWGPKWAVNVTKNAGQKWMGKWSQNYVTLGAQRGPKGAPKIDHFFNKKNVK